MVKAKQFSSASNKLARYDRETGKLVLGAMEFQDLREEKFSLPDIVYLLRDSFKKHVTRYRVLGERGRLGGDPSCGYCMISSYLIYSMTGGDDVWELRGTNLHWWLYHKSSGTVFDVTHTQFAPKELPGIYKMGKPVKELKTDEMFYDVLKSKAMLLAKQAGIE